MFMQIYQQFISKDFKLSFLDIMNNWSWDDFDDFLRKYVADVENNSKWDIVGSFFEGIGVLVKRGLVNPALVDDLMSGHTLMSWEKMEPVYFELRRRWNWPQIAEWWEYLYNEIKAIASEQHPELLDRRIGTLDQSLVRLFFFLALTSESDARYPYPIDISRNLIPYTLFFTSP